MESEVEDNVWKAPDGSFTKVVLSKGFGFFTPQDGSICKVKVLGDENSIVQPLDGDAVKDVKIGEADSEMDKILEACVKTMKEEEVCELIVTGSVEEDEDMSPTSCDGNRSPVDVKMKEVGEEGDAEAKEDSEEREESTVEEETGDDDRIKVKLQLLVFTREPEIWEMSITEKWRRASHHKAKGVELYSAGKIKWAFRRFGLALRYVVSLEHDIPPEHKLDEQGMDIKGLKVSCYINIAACQLKHNNYNSAVINCTKALELDPNNLKALFRRGVALIHIQEYERAKEDLDKVSEMEPEHPVIAKQQQKLKARVQKLNAYYANAMKKMFS
ncbi:LOW QUALITY PROTEIN: FK506-binding protein-like [Centruroides vittatus]|uniref:LOW QUALITY PROTEIN: FK506-binding protein-like n=1 Tax=Centruroides vittatus TaxID=120091 RepID=UPI00350EDD2B